MQVLHGSSAFDGAHTLVVQLGSAYTRFSTGTSTQDVPSVIPTIVAYHSSTSGIVRDSYAADAEEKRDAAVKYATSAINKQKKKGKAAAGGGGNAFFDEVKTVQVYNQQNCTTRIPMHQDLDWNWTSVREEGVLVGDQVNAIPMQYSNRYSLFYPIRHGRLNVVQGEDGIGSTRRALDALEDIFKVIVKKVMPKAKSASEEEDNDDHEDEDDTRLSKYAVVLVIPDSFSKRETLDLVSLLLDRIGFGAVGLHLESVLSCFGAGVSSACVLDIGAQKTIVSCVKDGIVVPNSVYYAPYGGDDLDKLLLYLCQYFSSVQKEHSFNLPKIDLAQNAQHITQIRKMKETCCKFLDSTRVSKMKSFEFMYRESGKETLVIGQNLNSSACVAPTGFFNTDLILPSVEATIKNLEIVKRYAEQEDFRDSFMSDDSSVIEADYDVSSIYFKSEENPEPQIFGLEKLIQMSLSQISDAESRKIFAKQILLSGGSAKLAGLIDELEESLIEYLPRFMSDIELVDVLAPKESDYSYLSWKGASIMAQVEGFKPCFLHQAEWQNSGINALKSKLPFLW